MKRNLPVRTAFGGRATAATLVLFIPGLVCGTAPAADDVLTPKDLFRLRAVSSTAISPDGEHVAYILSVPRTPMEDEDGKNYAELHVVDQRGGTRPFVTGDVEVKHMAWTQDGRNISYLAKRGDDKHVCLYVIPVDGGESRSVLCHKTDIKEYDWSPDGKQVAFIAEDARDEKKKKLQKKGFDQEIYEEDHRPVRVWIATPEDDDAEPRALELPGFPSDLDWSPVGTQIAVALAPSPSVDDQIMNRKLHVIHAETGDVVREFAHRGKLGDIRWSPDGRHLAVIAAEDLHDPRDGRLMVGSPDDGQLRDILVDYPGHVTAIAWQDDDTLLYLGDEGVWTTLGEIRRDGTQRKVHVPTGGATMSGLTLSSDGQHAAIRADSPGHPFEVWGMSHGEPKPRRLTDSNPWLRDIRMAPQEVVTYSARDGERIEGLLVRPLDEKPGQRYPLILTVHGGPESHDRNGWLTRYCDAGQIGAARGFAVFYPNYRGSTGRGVAFSKAGQGDYAGKEFDDLIDGVDHLIESGLVDGKRVGITGGSYGGFAAAWGATYHSERFAAAVMFVGVSNHVSKAGTTDIPDEMYLVHARKRLWDAWPFFLERSPVYHVQNARTPLLILHGKKDTRVNPGQSLELYRHLKTLDQVPVRLVLYPDEGHGNRAAASRYDYNLRMLRWFEHYLKGSGGEPPPGDLDYDLSDDAEGETDRVAERAP